MQLMDRPILSGLAFILQAMLLVLFGSCNRQSPPHSQTLSSEDRIPILWQPADDSAMVSANENNENERLRYTLIESRISDKNELFRPLYNAVRAFPSSSYKTLEPLVLEQDIPTLQSHIRSGRMTYEQLTLFYLYRIYHFELSPEATLNTIVALNRDVLEQARARDSSYNSNPQAARHPIFGIPVLLKDNINAGGMPTTAGAAILMDNTPDDAFVVKQLREKGALILGKVNLSEWAYWLCEGCPTGYSAVGGQTLNPFGRGKFESGGSSSGSATSITANYAAVAVGTETSGSILSPAGQNSLVGLKPSVGIVSRTGIVPISSTLDTPGPMAKNVIDAAIFLDAMTAYDPSDDKSVEAPFRPGWYRAIGEVSLKGKIFGAFKDLLKSDTLYRSTIETIASAGAKIVPLDPLKIAMDGFISILNVDMNRDLPVYLETFAATSMVNGPLTVGDIIAFNLADSLTRIPYGQKRLRGVVQDTMTPTQMSRMNLILEKEARKKINQVMLENRLDALLSVNNRHAAAVAITKYPALGIPMGFRENGEPANLTFICKRFEEEKLTGLARAFEKAFPSRRPPAEYGEIQ
jgi:amidase